MNSQAYLEVLYLCFPSVFAPLTATVRPTAATVTSQPQKPMSSRTASIRPLIPVVTPTAMVSPTVPPVHPSATQVVNPIVSSSSLEAAVDQRSQPDVVPGPSRGQAPPVFKTPRIVATVTAQEESGPPETQATVAPIVALTDPIEDTAVDVDFLETIEVESAVSHEIDAGTSGDDGAPVLPDAEEDQEQRYKECFY